MPPTQHPSTAKKPHNVNSLVDEIKQWGMALGFQQIGISDINLDVAEAHLKQWLEKQYHGEMNYMLKHGDKRSRPDLLLPGTLSVISARMDYYPHSDIDAKQLLLNKDQAYISRYALGRDYHKIMRKRLQMLASKISGKIEHFGYRVFSDSAPVMEKALAEKAGLGWIGKHSNLIQQQSGSWFFLGEIYTDIALPKDQIANNHCGTCQACIDCCPTKAIVAPYQVDARLCISYLTIELHGPIPVELRPLIGNRIYGCDDCQLFCPWNRFAQTSKETDYHPRHQLDNIALRNLFAWEEKQFLKNTEGSAIRRIGYERWLRNIAVALGNANPSEENISVLKSKNNHQSALVLEHICWAIDQQKQKLAKK